MFWSTFARGKYLCLVETRLENFKNLYLPQQLAQERNRGFCYSSSWRFHVFWKPSLEEVPLVLQVLAYDWNFLSSCWYRWEVSVAGCPDSWIGFIWHYSHNLIRYRFLVKDSRSGEIVFEREEFGDVVAMISAKSAPCGPMASDRKSVLRRILCTTISHNRQNSRVFIPRALYKLRNWRVVWMNNTRIRDWISGSVGWDKDAREEHTMRIR